MTPKRSKITTRVPRSIDEIPDSLAECELLLDEIGYLNCEVWLREEDRILVTYRNVAYSIVFQFEDDLVSCTLVDGWPVE